MKFAGFIVATLAAGGLVAWLAPTARAPSPPTDAPPTDGATRAAVRASGWSDGEVVLPRERDGHFYAEVAVDGVATRMLVDTGASVVALTGDDADSLGIAWKQHEVQPVARSASGPVEGVRVTIDSMRLGDLEVRAVEGVVIPEGLRVSLLGQSFLSQVPRVEMDSESMVLGS